MTATIVLLIVLLLSGCTTIGHQPPPADWPQLEVIKHRVSNVEMRDQCARYVTMPIACAIVTFWRNVCHIYLDVDNTTDEIEEHEDMHCKGWDHMGETIFRDAWEAYKRGTTTIIPILTPG